MRSTKYESYKFGTIEWSEKIPSHWEIKQLRYICTCEDGKRIPLNSEERSMRQGEYPYWGANSIVDYVDEWLFDEELVLLGEDGAPFLEVNKTVSFLSKGKIWPNNHIHVLRPKEPGSGAFIAKALNAVDYSSVITGSTRAKLNQGAMNGIKIPWPSAKERIAIVKFLDHETAKIDALIAEQERLIELLQEKRQAVISHAVTKGLNPNALMKDSGVEWLGEVPEHWEVGPIKLFLSSMNYKRVPLSAEERSSRQGNYPYYGASGIIDSVDDFLFNESLVLVSEDGANLLMRSTPIAFEAHGEYWVNNHAHILRPNDGLTLFWSERIESVEIAPFVTGSAQPKLTADALLNLTISCPLDPEEKKAIEERIQSVRVELEPLIEAAENAVKLLCERRSALISAAVTGQIDVRGLVVDEEGA